MFKSNEFIEWNDFLSMLGAQVVHCPLQEYRLDDSHKSDLEQRLKTTEVLYFCSVNAVRFFFKILFQLGQDARSLAGIKILAVGTKTADMLSQYGIQADWFPDQSQGREKTLADAPLELSDQEILLPCSNRSPKNLKEKYKKLHYVPVYQTLDKLVDSIFKIEKKDVLWFSSQSMVDAFLKSHLVIEDEVAVIAMGYETKSFLMRHQIKNIYEMTEPNMDALFQILSIL